MEILDQPLPNLLVIKNPIFQDERGYFFEAFQENKFKSLGLDVRFVQDNVSSSKKGVIRGLHAQKDPYAQGKLIRVLKGKVWDVAVDFRPQSPTFGQHYGLYLEEGDGLSFWIPPGFLHGFIALTDNTLFSYKVSGGLYHKESEIGVLWNDPELGIQWPTQNMEPIVSEKDQVLPLFKDLTL